MPIIRQPVRHNDLRLEDGHEDVGSHLLAHFYGQHVHLYAREEN